MENNIEIPEELQNVCKELAKVAAKNGLYGLSGKFNAPTPRDWSGEIQFRWEAGRHNEDSNNITIWSNLSVTTKINEAKHVLR